jgi:hypothetical protein
MVCRSFGYPLISVILSPIHAIRVASSTENIAIKVNVTNRMPMQAAMNFFPVMLILPYLTYAIVEP